MDWSKLTDLALILVILTSLTGLAWAYDQLKFAPKRRRLLSGLPDNAPAEQIAHIESVPAWVDFGRSLFPVFLIVLILRSFIVEPFRIPSGSMMPTLLIGDFILVNKYEYGLRLPVLNWKFFDISEPKRGDIVVFRYPQDPKIPYIKRIIGLPGDKIEYNYLTRMLYVNGEPVLRDSQGIYKGVGQGSGFSGAEKLIEHLPPNVDHEILTGPGQPRISGYYWSENQQRMLPADSPARVGMLHIDRVPDGQYFVLGDNRDNSRDSRYWGMVPEQNLVGRAFFIWMNLNLSPIDIDWSRLGTILK